MIDNVDFDDIAMFILALIIPSFIKRHYKYVSGKRKGFVVYLMLNQSLYRF